MRGKADLDDCTAHAKVIPGAAPGCSLGDQDRENHERSHTARKHVWLMIKP